MHVELRPRRRPISRCRGFARCDLVAVTLVTATGLGVLPAMAAGLRPEAQRTQSMSNLRELGVAHRTYEAEWNGRQWTLVPDSLAQYGQDPAVGWQRWAQAAEQPRRGARYGTIGGEAGGDPVSVFGDVRDREPIQFDRPRGSEGHAFGAFRTMNVASFNQYVDGRFHGETFYAPDDHVAQARLRGVTGGPNLVDREYAVRTDADGAAMPPIWSSYILSPAAMFNPQVMMARRPGVGDAVFGGWSDPWRIAAGFRSPAIAQVRYPALKSHMLEHAWLGDPRSGIHPAAGDLREGEVPMPRLFNGSPDAEPATAFMDGHVSTIAVSRAVRDDERMRRQTNGMSGLWSRDTPLGDRGYYHDLYEAADGDGEPDGGSSFHVLTTDGVLGRDVLAPAPLR